MLRNSSPGPNVAGTRNSRVLVRAVLGTLLAANLIAAGLVLFPPGGSAEQLGRELAALQSQMRTRQQMIERTRAQVAAIEKGRAEGDEFLDHYFLASRTAFSTLASELQAAASQSKLKEREHAYDIQPVEGSDTLSMLTITAAYEGNYSDLVHFLREIDRSPRLLIIDSLNAAPQQGSGMLTVSMKLEAFIRDKEDSEPANSAKAVPPQIAQQQQEPGGAR
jgi:Tfp pilus assembly protein PilO